jgi:hypothetical protein
MVFGFSSTTIISTTYQIIYNLASLVNSIIIVIYLFAFSKYFFIVKTESNLFLFGKTKLTKQPKFLFKKTLVAKHYAQ